MCEVLLGYPGALIFTLGTLTATPTVYASHSGEQHGGGHRRICTCPENFTEGHVSIVMKDNNSHVVHVICLTHSHVIWQIK